MFTPITHKKTPKVEPVKQDPNHPMYKLCVNLVACTKMIDAFHKAINKGVTVGEAARMLTGIVEVQTKAMNHCLDIANAYEKKHNEAIWELPYS